MTRKEREALWNFGVAHACACPLGPLRPWKSGAVLVRTGSCAAIVGIVLRMAASFVAAGPETYVHIREVPQGLRRGTHVQLHNAIRVSYHVPIGREGRKPFTSA